MANPFLVKAHGSRLSAVGTDFTPTIHSDTYDFIKPEQFDLNGRAVLITGASRGIGRDTALAFARAGASHIAVGARSPLDKLKAEIEHAAVEAGRHAPKVLILQLDISDYASVELAANKVEEHFGRLDVLINNAGHAESFKNITESKVDEWKRGWEINVFGLYHVTRAFLSLLLKSEGGLKEIVNLTSVGANFVMPGGSGYQSGKLAIIRFSEFTIAENPEIAAYIIHPGGVKTDMAKSLGKEMEQFLTDKPQLAADAIVVLECQETGLAQWAVCFCDVGHGGTT